MRGEFKHVYPVVKSINPFTLDDTNALSNPHKNTILSVDCLKTNSLTSSYEDRNVISDKLSNSYNRTTLYPIYSVFPGIKSSIGVNLYTYGLKDYPLCNIY